MDKQANWRKKTKTKDTYLEYPADKVHEEYTMEGGELVDFTIVQYTLLGGKEHQVVRADCSHGYPHMDINYTKPPKKEKLPDLKFKELVKIVLHKINENWRDYKKNYIKIQRGMRQ